MAQPNPSVRSADARFIGELLLFLCPLFNGKLRIGKLCYRYYVAAKTTFIFPFNTTILNHCNKVEPHYVGPQGLLLSAKVSYERIALADQRLPGDNLGIK